MVGWRQVSHVAFDTTVLRNITTNCGPDRGVYQDALFSGPAWRSHSVAQTRCEVKCTVADTKVPLGPEVIYEADPRAANADNSDQQKPPKFAIGGLSKLDAPSKPSAKLLNQGLISAIEMIRDEVIPKGGL